jgi:hypothetical protein
VRLSIVFLSLSVTFLVDRYQPPWDDSWKLDEKFFKQMEAWEKEHPESTFAKVIDNVNSAVLMCKSFLEFIPDSPFPARSLVHSLAYLLQLGTVRIVLPLGASSYQFICRQSLVQRRMYTILRCRCRPGSTPLRLLCEKERKGNFPLVPKRISL